MKPSVAERKVGHPCLRDRLDPHPKATRGLRADTEEGYAMFKTLGEQPGSAIRLAQLGIRANYKSNAGIVLRSFTNTWKMVEKEIFLFCKGYDYRIQEGPLAGSYVHLSDPADRAVLIETYYFLYTHEFGKYMKRALTAAKVVNVVATVALKAHLAGLSDPAGSSTSIANFMTNFTSEATGTALGGPGTGPDADRIADSIAGVDDVPSAGAAAYNVAYALDSLANVTTGGEPLAAAIVESGSSTEAEAKLTQDIRAILSGKYRCLAVQQKTPLLARESPGGRSWYFSASDTSEILIGETSLGVINRVMNERAVGPKAVYVVNPWAEKAYLPSATDCANAALRTGSASFSYLRSANQVDLEDRPDLTETDAGTIWNPLTWQWKTASSRERLMQGKFS
ncbi:hypothetical protein [Piscinibacter sakaiensis]|uniref:hypothetical protein n=1 Tax=Piscinibacter sakaiensis TaxID=1547922 RepID=UPI003AAE82AA